jgi:hypothetical protein
MFKHSREDGSGNFHIPGILESKPGRNQLQLAVWLSLNQHLALAHPGLDAFAGPDATREGRTWELWKQRTLGQ